MSLNTPGTAGGPGGRDRTLAVKSRKNVRKITFFSLQNKIYTLKIYFFCIYLLVMPKYWGKQISAHGRFPEVDQKQKTERKKERERPNDGDNNAQATHGARMAHAWRTHGARKPPGPKRVNDGDNNGQAMYGARKHAWRTQAVWANKL